MTDDIKYGFRIEYDIQRHDAIGLTFLRDDERYTVWLGPETAMHFADMVRDMARVALDFRREPED